MCDIIDHNNSNVNTDIIPINEIEEHIELEKVCDVSELKQNKYTKYDNLVQDINRHIKSYSQFVDNKYFEEIYSEFKTEQELKLLKDFSETIFEINNDDDLENFMKYSEQAEKIMKNTDGMVGFCKSFSECFVWHIQQIIMKIDKEIKQN